jgi:hypothetical protein
MDVANRTRWQNCDLGVRAECVARYFWTTVSIDVHLAGLCILRTAGVLKLAGSQINNFKHNDEVHEVKLSWKSRMRGMYFPYQLFIDGEAIISSRVYPYNWPLVLIPIITIPLALAAFFLIIHRIFS